MQTRRTILSLALAAATAALPLGAAFASEPYSQAAFDAAIAAGHPVLIDVTAPWCSTCRAQKPILSELTGQASYADLVVFEVDYDSEKDLLAALGVHQQSTLIVYAHGHEVGRSTGETDPDAIAALLARTSG